MSEWMCSCVILNYNDAETTIKLVNKIHTFACLRWIVVVDNCSCDDSWRTLDAIRGIDKVITLKTEKNGGYGYGNNFGVRYAYDILRETTILIVNPDVEFSEECLRACIAALRRSVDAAAVSPVQLNKQGDRVVQYAWNLCSGLRTLLPCAFLLRHTLFPLPCAEVDFREREVAVDCVPGSFLLVDAEKFIQAGGYNEKMFLYWEEMMLGSRMCHAGWKTLLLPQQTYLHLHSVSVSKSIPRIVTQRRLQNESLLIYLQEVCGYGPIRLFLAKWFLKCCLFEEKILALVRLRRNRRG